MKIPDSPEELLRMAEQGHDTKACQCRVCTNLRHLEKSGMSVQEIVAVSYVMLGMSLKAFESGLQAAIRSDDHQDATILANLLGLLYSATNSVGLFRGALEDYRQIVDGKDE